MFFSNLAVYKFKDNDACKYKQEELEQALQKDRFRRCNAQDLHTRGWDSAFGSHGEVLAHFSNDFILLRVANEEKLLPAKVVNEVLGAEIEAIRIAESRDVRKKEKSEIKEKILFQMAAEAFKFSYSQYAFIDTKNGLLIINSASFSKAEEFAALLRKSIGTLPIMPAFGNVDLDVHLTSWLTEAETPKPFEFGSDVELEEADDSGAQAKLKGHELTDSEEVRIHLDGGKRVTKLALNWNDRIKFTLQNDGAIKRVSFSDIIKEENADIPKEDMPIKLDADFVLCASELSQLVVELLGAVTTEDKGDA